MTTLANTTPAALNRAHAWMRDAGALNADAVEATSYRDTVLLSGDAMLALHLAYAVALAEAEIRAADNRRSWDHRDRAHLQHLIDTAGYEPTDWERQQCP